MRIGRQWVKRKRLLRRLICSVENALSAIRPGISAPARDTSPEFFLSAMIRVKDEARFMPEWIAHHLQLGVEHVFIYDNNSTDGLDTVLAPFIERSLVTIVKWPNVPVAPSCYYDFLRRFGALSQWVSFFDADEFLFESTPGATLRALEAHRNRPALAVNFRYFGSSWHELIPVGLVTENFTRANVRLNSHVKVIAQPAFIKRWRNDHNFLYRDGRLARTPDGRRVLGSFIKPAEDPELVLHHYVYRSREDYERKARRTYATARGAITNVRNQEKSETEFNRHNEAIFLPPVEITKKTQATLHALGYGEPFVSQRAPQAAHAR